MVGPTMQRTFQDFLVPPVPGPARLSRHLQRGRGFAGPGAHRSAVHLGYFCLADRAGAGFGVEPLSDTVLVPTIVTAG